MTVSPFHHCRIRNNTALDFSTLLIYYGIDAYPWHLGPLIKLILYDYQQKINGNYSGSKFPALRDSRLESKELNPQP